VRFFSILILPARLLAGSLTVLGCTAMGPVRFDYGLHCCGLYLR
jgi:hypothetical protein